jgi:hypothetical protein
MHRIISAVDLFRVAFLLTPVVLTLKRFLPMRCTFLLMRHKKGTLVSVDTTRQLSEWLCDRCGCLFGRPWSRRR